MIPQELKETISSKLGVPDTFEFVGGGCINHGGKVTIDGTSYFLKWNDRLKYPGMFEAEKAGLQLMSDTKTVSVPEVIEVIASDSFQAIILEWVEHGSPPAGMDSLGVALARMHRTSSSQYGLPRSNYIGSLVQRNSAKDTWVEFFSTQRLNPLVKMASDAGLLTASDVSKLDQLQSRLPDLLPDEPDSLLHGDLWGGNILASTREYFVLDPAVYFGHREMDVAFTHMFGGFDRSFYAGYEEEYPLQPGFSERIDLHNLYPLLVHVNLFGSGYVGQLRSSVNRYV